MPKKRFEERPYDPISADLVRDVTAIKSGINQHLSMALVPPNGLQPFMPKTPLAHTPSLNRPPPAQPLLGQAEPTITKRFLLSRAEDAEMNAFLLRLQQSARSKITLSVLVRAALAVVMEAEQTIRSELEQQSIRLPSTHDRLALSEFEDRWRQCLTGAFRPSRS